MILENNLTIMSTEVRSDSLAPFSCNDTNIIINQDFEAGVVMHVMIAIVTFFIVAVNCWVISCMCSKTQTLVDSMILQDCVANMGGLVSFFFHYPKIVWGSDHWCRFTLIVTCFFTILNRVIPITIAIYRYLLVCQAEKTAAFGKTKLARLLLTTNSLVPLGMTILILAYAESYFPYTVCLGREEIFHVDLNDLLGEADPSFWNMSRFMRLPIYNPVRLAFLLMMLTYSLLIPGVYLGMFWFRWKQDRTVTGNFC